MRNSPLDEAIDAAAVTQATGRDPEVVADRHPFREAFDRELGAVKEGVLRMGSLVEEQILAALRSLVDHDADRALAVMAADGRINEVQRDVSAQIVMTIATQQPVARDLRFLLALDHVTAELERMGDHAGSVAKQARKLAPFAPIGGYRKLERMAELAAELVHGVLLALVDVDEVRARGVAGRDDEIDDLYHALFDEVLEAMRSDPVNVNPGARVLFAAHYLERIGDRVTNIAEDVVFLATGEIEDLNP
ncbi:MAG TPA: phosphate signaling complex protein PhoU [Candidatus Limnocylindrales bacterium]|jgi:phosphate transport system protein